MSKDPVITCIVPVYNGERFLAETLDSILNQTYGRREVLVIDDGSTDGTPDIMAGYGDRVRHIRQEHAGQEEARNHGVREARGDFIAFLDADDLWHREKLALQVVAFRERPELGACFTRARNFKDHLASQDILTSAPEASDGLPAFISGALLARRSLFDQVGLFDTAWSHACDTEWILRVKEAGIPWIMLPEVLFYRRVHGGNLSLRHAKRSRETYLELLKHKLDRERAGR